MHIERHSMVGKDGRTPARLFMDIGYEDGGESYNGMDLEGWRMD